MKERMQIFESMVDLLCDRMIGLETAVVVAKNTFDGTNLNNKPSSPSRYHQVQPTALEEITSESDVLEPYIQEDEDDDHDIGKAIKMLEEDISK
jgi:hypothetical protein